MKSWVGFVEDHSLSNSGLEIFALLRDSYGRLPEIKLLEIKPCVIWSKEERAYYWEFLLTAIYRIATDDFFLWTAHLKLFPGTECVYFWP